LDCENLCCTDDFIQTPKRQREPKNIPNLLKKRKRAARDLPEPVQIARKFIQDEAIGKYFL